MVIWRNIWTWFRLAKPMKWGSYEVPIMHLPICLYVFLRFFLWNGMLNFLSSWMKWKYSKKQQLDFWGKSFILSKCNQNEMGIFVFFFFFFFFRFKLFFFVKYCIEVYWAQRGSKCTKNEFFQVLWKIKIWNLSVFFVCEVTAA